ncbi:hypothetical protein ACFQE0_04290 [Methylobacterium komagatae]|uniref:Alpha 1,4-glycosyltransferase domain-containing protein n=1 Tax=Methylobacterium komagatae TaxID=374425 RepID=A0ABW2BG95_9HYPH
MTQKPKFGTFWAGPRLSALEVACLSSFARKGYEVELYSYDKIENVPADVAVRDAGDVLSSEFLNHFKINGKVSYSHFSDLFRYNMFLKTQNIWIDTDLFLTRAFDFPLDGRVLAKESPSVLCGAIMRLPSNDPHLPVLISETEAIATGNFRWGATGPKLLTKRLDKAAIDNAYGPEIFFPISYTDFWKTLLPEYAEECRQQTQKCYTLHLWNNIVDRLGYWKDYLPPEGSYLHAQIEQAGLAGEFKGTYPRKIMSAMVENWLLRKSGRDLGIKTIVKQIVPSVGRTIKHYSS